ncbi:MAG TPA: hypothetical protein PLC32_02835 [Candidatus Omnitrophota bacterium]|nr:hypothetical protein [Candidatus Omnitrophota bacterium]
MKFFIRGLDHDCHGFIVRGEFFELIDDHAFNLTGRHLEFAVLAVVIIIFHALPSGPAGSFHWLTAFFAEQ